MCLDYDMDVEDNEGHSASHILNLRTDSKSRFPNVSIVTTYTMLI